MAPPMATARSTALLAPRHTIAADEAASPVPVPATVAGDRTPRRFDWASIRGELAEHAPVMPIVPDPAPEMLFYFAD